MNNIKIQILLENLLSRIESKDDGSHHLPGIITSDELHALKIAIKNNSSESTTTPSSDIQSRPLPDTKTALPIPDEQLPYEDDSHEVTQETRPTRVNLDLSSLNSETQPNDIRICLDFGTAMSKAVLVHDRDDIDSEEIYVLELGYPGDQEEISEVMLISSVYIDNVGILWFGKAAVDRSVIEGIDGSRQRLDNIKRRLSEAGWNEEVGSMHNPTDVSVTQGDMVLAYLMYMTWAVNDRLNELDFPLNISRRFAMPCLPGAKGKEVDFRLKQLINEARVLADTFQSTIKNGIPLLDFIATVNELREVKPAYPNEPKGITEPLGVAGSLLSWRSNVDMLVMVVDIGAGTSDLSLFRIHVDPEKKINAAVEIANSSRVLTQAGNYLDRALIELILKESGVTSEDPQWIKIRSRLELQIREHKETLFNEEFVYVHLENETNVEVEVELEDFLRLEPVRKFGEALQNTMQEILESINESWIDWIKSDPHRKLVVALTGGGADLPMVRSLAQGTVLVNGSAVPIAQAISFPNWIRELDENLEADYPRIAVALGGARKQLIQHGGTATITAYDAHNPPVLERF